MSKIFGILTVMSVALLSACTTSQRTHFEKSLSVELANADSALAEYRSDDALQQLNKVEARIKEWKKLGQAEQMALMQVQEEVGLLRHVAQLFAENPGEGELESLKKTVSSPRARGELIERFLFRDIGPWVWTTTSYLRYIVSGHHDVAERGFSRLVSWLDEEKLPDKILLFRLRVTRASAYVGLNDLATGEAELERVRSLLASEDEKIFWHMDEYRSFTLLPAYIKGRRGEFQAGADHLADVLRRHPDHPYKADLENRQKRFADVAKRWSEEQARYASEAADLPRVLMKTSEGDMEIVLFEDDAPQSVANFISLAEDDYFDDTLIHRLMPIFVAQGGDATLRGRDDIGYCIRLEAVRSHFRGCIGMARSAHENSATSQWYFCLDSVATSGLDSRYAVFGRVVERDLPVLDKLRLGSKVVSVRVLAKRDHAYEPEKLPEPEDE